MSAIAAELSQSSLSLASSGGGSGVEGAATDFPVPEIAQDKALIKDELIKPVGNRGKENTEVLLLFVQESFFCSPPCKT